MTQLLAVMRKEMLLILPRPALWMQLIVLPAVLVLLISFAFENVLGSPERLPLPVVDMDESAQSRSLVDALQSTGYLDVKVEAREGDTAFTESDAIARFDHGRRPAVLVIPAGYGVGISTGQPVELKLFTDPAQPSPATLIETSIQAVADQLSLTNAAARIAVSLSQRDSTVVESDVAAGASAFLASPPLRPEVVTSDAGRGLPSPFEQTVPAFTMWFSATIGSYLYWIMLAERLEWGVGSRILSIASSRWPHVLGKAAVAYLFGAFQFLVMMGAAHVFFEMEVGSVSSLAGVIATFLLIPVTIGIVVAAVGDEMWNSTFMVGLRQALGNRIERELPGQGNIHPGTIRVNTTDTKNNMGFSVRVYSPWSSQAKSVSVLHRTGGRPEIRFSSCVWLSYYLKNHGDAIRELADLVRELGGDMNQDWRPSNVRPDARPGGNQITAIPLATAEKAAGRIAAAIAKLAERPPRQSDT